MNDLFIYLCNCKYLQAFEWHVCCLMQCMQCPSLIHPLWKDVINTFGFFHSLDASCFIPYTDILFDISGFIMITMTMLTLCSGLIIEDRWMISFMIISLVRTWGSCLFLMVIYLRYFILTDDTLWFYVGDDVLGTIMMVGHV